MLTLCRFTSDESYSMTRVNDTVPVGGEDQWRIELLNQPYWSKSMLDWNTGSEVPLPVEKLVR